MTWYGYIRISDKHQHEDRQRIKMLELGIKPNHIFCDKASGKNFDRKEYETVRRVIEEGDVLFLDALDRLGRDYDGIINEWKYITRELNADIVVLEQESLFDSRKFKAMGDFGKVMEDQFLSLLSYVASEERKKMLTRQKEGYNAARLRGQTFGRPKIEMDSLTKEQRRNFNKFYKVWESGDLIAVAFMGMLSLKKNTFYKIVKEYEQTKKGTAMEG